MINQKKIVIRETYTPVVADSVISGQIGSLLELRTILH